MSSDFDPVVRAIHSLYAASLPALEGGKKGATLHDYLLRELQRPILQFYDQSFATLAGLTISASSAPSPPPPPSEEFILLKASFDLSFAALAAEVKELKTQISGSNAPSKGTASPKPATHLKPSVQPKPSGPPHAPAKPAASKAHSCPPFSSAAWAPA
ncbi:hypothetical protein EI94DRAFT_1816212 [Lactarius quietus]|nr:hypothetical protein EI94DRAFT_1816212 [Lactarius quietus]